MRLLASRWRTPWARLAELPLRAENDPSAEDQEGNWDLRLQPQGTKLCQQSEGAWKQFHLQHLQIGTHSN